MSQCLISFIATSILYCNRVGLAAAVAVDLFASLLQGLLKNIVGPVCCHLFVVMVVLVLAFLVFAVVRRRFQEIKTPLVKVKMLSEE